MKHVFFALYDGREYTRIEPLDINYYLSKNVDVYAVVINLREVKTNQRIELAGGVSILIYWPMLVHLNFWITQ